MERSAMYEVCAKNDGQEWSYKKQGSIKVQLRIASCVLLGNILIGYALGWSAPIARKLQDARLCPFPHVLTEDEVSWLASVVTVGVIIGANGSGSLSNIIGRKPCLIIGGLLIIIGYSLLTAALNLSSACAGRIIAGLGAGSIISTNLIYIGEISSTHIRGTLLASTGVMHTLGCLLVYSVGPYVSYYLVGGILMALSTVFVIGCCNIPESPMFYMIRGEKNKAKAVLHKLERHEEIDNYMKVILKSKDVNLITNKEILTGGKELQEDCKKRNGWKWLQVFTVKRNRKAFIITVILFIIQQTGGSSVVVFYATGIFASAGSSIVPDVATVILGTTELLGSLVTVLLIERAGRRILVLLSTFGCCICLILMGAYFYLKLLKHPTTSSLGWIPLVLLILFIFFYNNGLAIVPSTLVGEMFSSNVRNTGSCITMSIVNLGHILTGYSMGYSSPVLVKLLDNEQSPLPAAISQSETSWVASSYMAGVLIGLIPFGILSNAIGRKPSIILSSFLMLLGQTLLAVSLDTVWIYSGQIIKGIGVSGVTLTDCMYVGEIASPNIRGILATSTSVFHTFGILLVYAVGPYVSYRVVSYLFIIINVVHAFCCWYVLPESPVFYVIKDKQESAKKALHELGRSKDIETELKAMIEIQKQNHTDTKCLQLFTTKSNRKALIINTVLVVLNQGGGILWVLMYATIIFKQAGSLVEPEVASIILGVTQFIGSIVTPVFIEKCGRKTLLLLSFPLCSLFLTILGVYFYLELINYSSIASIRWLPLFALMTYLFSFSFGVNCIPNVLLGETFRPNMRSLGAATAATAGCLTGFISSASFSAILTAVGSHNTSWIFAAINLFGFLFTIFIVPETKGKSLVEIEAMLG